MKKILISLILFLFLSGCSGGNDDEQKKSPAVYNPSLSATVKDLTAPKIICDDIYNIDIDSSFDIAKKIKVSDNTDKSPTLSIEGKIDVHKVGTYKVTITAKDKDGNITNKIVTVVVKKKEEAKSPIKTEKDNESNSPITIDPNTTNENKTNDNNNNQNSDSSSNQATLKKPTAQERDFMFVDGKSFDETHQECMNYGEQLINEGKANYVRCDFFEDQDGIAIGYHLYLR